MGGEVSEDIYEDMPGRKDKEAYSVHPYQLTFDDVDMDRQVFRRVFEEFDNREEFTFEWRNPVQVLNNEIEYEEGLPTDYQSYNSGDEVLIVAEMPGVRGTIWSQYGPSLALGNEAVFSALAEMNVDLEGDLVVDAVGKITEQTEAPYLEADSESVFYEEETGSIVTGEFKVPATYTEADLEESVDAWLDRLSQVSEIQEDLREVMNRYA